MKTFDRPAQRLDGAGLFTRITDPATLMAGWQRCLANGGAAGGDGQTLTGFAQGLGQRLADLSADLRSGRYRPLPLREARIPKAALPSGFQGSSRPGAPAGPRSEAGSGSTGPARAGTRTDTRADARAETRAAQVEHRVLRIPSIRDRVVQSAAAQVLTPLLDLEMEDGSHGYRPGRGVQTAVRQLQFLRRQGFVWTVDADIDDFFDRIPIDALLDRLHRSITESPLSDLIGVWLEHGARMGRGVAQGSPISPLLANLYLDDLDETFSRRGLRIVRYADDFLVLTKDRPAAEEALRDLERFLADHGLALNREKTRLRAYDSNLPFLGHVFVRSWALKAEEEDGPSTAALSGEALLFRLARMDEEDDAREAAGQADQARLTKAGYDPGLRVLSIRSPDRRLTLRNQSFSVIDTTPGPGEPQPRKPRELVAIHPTRIDRIEIAPEVEVDPEAQRHALASAIPLAFTNGHGETLGHLAPTLSPRAGRHLAQARAVLDPTRRVELACRIVEARLANQRALLRRVNSRRQVPAVATTAASLGRTIRRLRIARSVSEAMGVEGLGAALYWRAFDRLLLNGFKLEGRSRRKKADPVNSALDLAASLLLRDMSAVVLARGLHPGFGVLHETADGRDACVFDLVEVFRAGLVESLVLRLTNQGQLRRTMFSTLEDGTVRMGGEAQRAIIRAYEAQATSTVTYPRTGQRMSWRRVMMLEAEAYAQDMEGRAPWQPFVLNY